MKRSEFIKALAMASGIATAATFGVLGCTSSCEQAAVKPTRILMIGNSFSVCNIQHMPEICRDMGIPLDLASLYIGGCSLRTHWENMEKCEADPTFRPYKFDRRICGVTNANSGVARVVPVGQDKIGILEALEMEKWDIVTIQQASYSSWRPDSYEPYGAQLIAAIRKLQPQAEIVVQETWSYTPFDKRLAKWGIDQNEMYAHLHFAYRTFAERHGLRIIPMGAAVQLWRKRLPVKYTENSFGDDAVGGRGMKRERHFALDGGKWVAKSDVFHLSEGGEYLQSLVWTAKLFGVDVNNCGYAPKWMDAERAKLMKAVAMEAVSAK